jgi:signal transduction histidine kinase
MSAPAARWAAEDLDDMANTIERPADLTTDLAVAIPRRRLGALAQDSPIASGLTATSVVGVVNDLSVDLPEGAADVAANPLDGLGVLLVLAQTAPTAWRRRAPLVVICVVTAAMFLYSVLGYVRSFAAFGFLLALFTVAAYEERSTSVPIGVAAGSLVLLILGFSPEPVEPDAVVATLLLVGSCWFIGDSARIRRGEVAQLEDRAARLEREREVLTREAVDAERRVIARELHDVIAHDVSVIVTQAAAAQKVADRHPDDAIRGLGAIERAGREAFLEMRRLMALLRPAGSTPPPLAPQPGLGDLASLVGQVRQAGLPLELRIEGAERPLSPGLDLCAYRIVQEAITNVMKHAGHARVSVLVRSLPQELELRIDDDGSGGSRRGPAGPHPGYGHLGMRERVSLFGGSLDVGPRPRGGYRVHAILSTEQEPS